MKGSTAYRSIQRRGLHIGLLPEIAAAIDPSTPITLDHDLDVLPEAGQPADGGPVRRTRRRPGRPAVGGRMSGPANTS